MRLRNQLLISAEKFGREDNLLPVPIPAMSKELDEQLKLAHKFVDVVNRTNRLICVPLLWYSVDKPESYYPEVRICSKEKEDETCRKNVSVKYKQEKTICLLDVMNSLYQKVTTNQSKYHVL